MRDLPSVEKMVATKKFQLGCYLEQNLKRLDEMRDLLSVKRMVATKKIQLDCYLEQNLERQWEKLMGKDWVSLIAYRLEELKALMREIYWISLMVEH